MRILSIDVGSVNCAFYVEEFDDSKLTLETLYSEGKVIYLELINFSKMSDDICTSIMMYLNSHLELWDTCNGIIIEDQLKTNPDAQHIQYFILSYFYITYNRFKFISSIPPTFKTQVLDAPKGMDKDHRKRWAEVEARKICEIRKDYVTFRKLLTGKSDDLSDTIVQLKAFQKRVFIENLPLYITQDGEPRSNKKKMNRRFGRWKKKK